MLTKQQKQAAIEALVEKLKRQKIFIFTDFRGVSVAGAQQLRRELRQGEGDYKVAKKTLIDLALTQAGIALKTKHLQGEIGIAFGYGEETAPAKILAKFSRTHETFKILGGVSGVSMLTDKDILALAKLPAREVMLAQVVGAFAAPIRGLVTVLQGNIRSLVVVLSKIKEIKTTAS